MRAVGRRGGDDRRRRGAAVRGRLRLPGRAGRDARPAAHGAAGGADPRLARRLRRVRQQGDAGRLPGPGDGAAAGRRGGGAGADRPVRRSRGGRHVLRLVRAGRRPEHLLRAVGLLRHLDRRRGRGLLRPAAGAGLRRRPRSRQLHRPHAGDGDAGPELRTRRLRLVRPGVRPLHRADRDGGDRRDAADAAGVLVARRGHRAGAAPARAAGASHFSRNE
ncbi:LigA [Anaeromyxobacter sp. Fw109-5]|nr:LigA [Anaeromyxobacter sp. Fw109-5]